MSPRPDITDLPDGDETRTYVRRVISRVVTTNADTGDLELIPQKAYVFDPDLSIHQEEAIVSLGSSVSDEYSIPENGAVYIPAPLLCGQGAFLKETPHSREPVLGPAHHSIFGKTLTPSKTDKAEMRDLLMNNLRWFAKPAS